MALGAPAGDGLAINAYTVRPVVRSVAAKYR